MPLEQWQLATSYHQLPQLASYGNQVGSYRWALGVKSREVIFSIVFVSVFLFKLLVLFIGLALYVVPDKLNQMLAGQVVTKPISFSFYLKRFLLLECLQVEFYYKEVQLQLQIITKSDIEHIFSIGKTHTVQPHKVFRF